MQIVHRAQALQDRAAQPQAVVDGGGLREIDDGALDVVVLPGQRDASDQVGLVLRFARMRAISDVARRSERRTRRSRVRRAA